MASSSSAATAESRSAASAEDAYWNSISTAFVESVVSVATRTLPETRLVTSVLTTPRSNLGGTGPVRSVILTSTQSGLIGTYLNSLEAAQTTSPGLPALPTVSSSTSSTPSTSPDLSPSAKVGIGLGIPFALLIIAIAAFSGFRFLKRRKVCEEKKEKYAAVPELYDDGGGQHVKEGNDSSAGQHRQEDDVYNNEQPYPLHSE